jgi:hypothetical protein
MFRNSGKTGPDRDTTQHSRAVSPTGRRPRPSSSAMDRWIHCCSINGSEDAGPRLHVGPDGPHGSLNY